MNIEITDKQTIRKLCDRLYEKYGWRFFAESDDYSKIIFGETALYFYRSDYVYPYYTYHKHKIESDIVHDKTTHVSCYNETLKTYEEMMYINNLSKI